MNKNTLYIILASVIAITAGIFAQQHAKPAKNKPSTPKLEFSLPDLAGKNHNISEWQDKIRIINFWATWCPPCLKEIPEFIRLQKQYNKQNIQFIGIAIEEKQPVEDYLKTIHINYPILIAGDAGIALSQQLGNIVNAVPFTLVVNSQGQVIHRQAGEFSTEKIFEIITPIINKPSS